MQDSNFQFKISLSVLNHLGRKLYRSFITVLGEAISNSWDADAEDVWVHVDRESNTLVVKDNGIGMSKDDFQNKFLKIGYSKREKEGKKSPKGRPYIGRKGIGKLALLSCAEEITVITKKANMDDYVGGVIDNSELDEAITEDLTTGKYLLKKPSSEIVEKYTKNHNHGTIIHFNNIEEGIRNRIEYLKTILALYFKFSLIDDSFNIFLEGEKINNDHLKNLAEKTEFLWKINKISDPYLDKTLTELKEKSSIELDKEIKGFIASVERPRDLKIYTTNRKISVDLFVNGRLREKNIIDHISGARVAEDYLYGQIHFNNLDDDKDRFTSSREGIVADDPKYEDFLKNIKNNVLPQVLKEWDEWRIKHREDGDPESDTLTKKERKSRELYNTVSKEYELPKDNPNKDKVLAWVEELGENAQYNFGSYAECFISENLLRKHIKEGGLKPKSCKSIDPSSGENCIDRNSDTLCEYCQGNKRKNGFQQQKDDAKMSIKIRNTENNILNYLDYIDLAKIIDDDILKNEDKFYTPLRNSVMHTSKLTDPAKTRLTSVFDNVIATVKQLIGKQ